MFKLYNLYKINLHSFDIFHIKKDYCLVNISYKVQNIILNQINTRTYFKYKNLYKKFISFLNNHFKFNKIKNYN